MPLAVAGEHRMTCLSQKIEEKPKWSDELADRVYYRTKRRFRGNNYITFSQGFRIFTESQGLALQFTARRQSQQSELAIRSPI
jgi:hypothetical protein